MRAELWASVSSLWLTLPQRGRGPTSCVERETGPGPAPRSDVEEMNVDRNIRLVYPAKRELSHAARAFLELVRSNPLG